MFERALVFFAMLLGLPIITICVLIGLGVIPV